MRIKYRAPGTVAGSDFGEVHDFAIQFDELINHLTVRSSMRSKIGLHMLIRHYLDGLISKEALVPGKTGKHIHKYYRETYECNMDTFIEVLKAMKDLNLQHTPKIWRQ